MLTLVSKDSVKISDHFDVLCVLIACMVLEIINQMSKNQKSSLIVWNTVVFSKLVHAVRARGGPPGSNHGPFTAKPSSHHVHVTLSCTALLTLPSSSVLGLTDIDFHEFMSD